MKEIEILYNPKPKNPIDDYTETKPSDIHGLGLFAKKKIPKGTIWWHARPQDVLIITKEQFLKLDSSNKTPSMNDFIETLLIYSYYERDLDTLIFCLDNSRFVNHSKDANSGVSEDENGFCAMALKDISPGEEITEDVVLVKTNPRTYHEGAGYFILKAAPVFTGTELKRAYRSQDSYGAPAVGFSLTSQGASKIRKFSAAN